MAFSTSTSTPFGFFCGVSSSSSSSSVSSPSSPSSVSDSVGRSYSPAPTPSSSVSWSSSRKVSSLQPSLPRSNRQPRVHLPLANTDHYASLLRECIINNDITEGMKVHDSIVQDNLDGDRYLGNILVEMYDKCGGLLEARLTFDRLKDKNVYTWNNIIAAYTRHGHDEEALHLFHEMLHLVFPSTFTFTFALGACNNIEVLGEGRFVHDNAIYGGLDADINVGTALIHMYGKCGSIIDAERVFHRLHEHNIVTYTAMMASYLHQSKNQEALEIFRSMIKMRIILDEFSFTTALGACMGLNAIEDGIFVHTTIVCAGFDSNSVIESALVNMYGEHGQFEDAKLVFAKSHERNVALFTSLITICVQLEYTENVLEIFMKMLDESLEPNELTYVSIITACAISTSLLDGKIIHHMIVCNGLESNFILASAIVNMFGKCGCLKDAHRVFEKISQRTIVTWNTLITAYTQQGYGKEVLNLYSQMQLQDVRPTEVTFINVLSACGTLSYLSEGKSIHMNISKHGLESHHIVGNALMSMYGKCGSLSDAFDTFRRMDNRDIVSWNAILAAYTQHGDHSEVFKLFEQMCHQGVKPDDITFISILSACSRAGLVLQGLQYFFSMSEDFGIEPRMEHYGCVIDLLGRAGQLEKVEDFIKKMPISPDSVAWKSFLAACSLHCDREKGQLVAESVFGYDTKEAPPYILLSNICIQ